MRRFHEFAELTSTNSWLAANYSQFDPPAFVRADRQTAGRGRMSRRWYSGASGENLVMSALLRVDTANPGLIPIIAGSAVGFALASITPVHIKWPNDIYAAGKKLGGILSERVTSEANVFVIGVGMNVNTTQFPDELGGEATSLQLLTGVRHDVRQLWVKLARSLHRALRGRLGPLSAEFIRDYNSRAWRYIRRPDIAGPVEFCTLLPDGRAQFATASGMVVLDTPA